MPKPDKPKIGIEVQQRLRAEYPDLEEWIKEIADSTYSVYFSASVVKDFSLIPTDQRDALFYLIARHAAQYPEKTHPSAIKVNINPGCGLEPVWRVQIRNTQIDYDIEHSMHRVCVRALRIAQLSDNLKPEQFLELSKRRVEEVIYRNDVYQKILGYAWHSF